jgi:hypothetical protein
MKYFAIILVAVFVINLCSCNERATDNDLYNTQATVPAKFDFSKLNLIVLNTSVNKMKNTMSILYGNEIAYDLLKNSKNTIMKGEMLTLLTWKQQEDKHWFGANIPGALLSVEIVQAPGDDNKTINYKRLIGPLLEQDKDTSQNLSREALILNQRPSVMP